MLGLGYLCVDQFSVSAAICGHKVFSITRRLTFPAFDRRQPVSRELCRRPDEFCRVTPRRYPATVDTASRQSWACHSERADRLAAEDFVRCMDRQDQGMSHAPPATSGVTRVPTLTPPTVKHMWCCIIYNNYTNIYALNINMCTTSDN